MLGDGTYDNVFATIPMAATNIQVIGNGPANTVVKFAESQDVDGTRRYGFNAGNEGYWGQNVNDIEFWNFTADCAGANPSTSPGGFYYGQGSRQIFQGLVVKNYASTLKGQELFVVSALAPLDSSGNTMLGGEIATVNNCRFTPASANNQDGVTVVALAAQPGTSATNNTFDPVTDPGTFYYHCMGYLALATGNTFTAGSVGAGEFWYTEPETGGQSSASVTITGNTVDLSNNLAYHFVGLYVHTNSSNPLTGPITIEQNTVSNGYVYYVGGEPPNSVGIPVQNLTIQHNYFTNVIEATFNGAATSNVILSPNP
jgi:hypothetical protein